MKVIIPMGGRGTRLRPHTHTRPKPLVHVAGKPVLGHILDKLDKLNVEEIIFITGSFSEQVEEYVSKNYSFKARYIPQTNPWGNAHAISLAKQFVDKDVLIIFADTLFEADLSVINQIRSAPSKAVRGIGASMGRKIDAESILWVKEVDDPRRFGVAFVQDGLITKLIEKPQTLVSNLALIGLYYFADGPTLMRAIDYIIAHDIKFKDEFFLIDAIQFMIDQGLRAIPQRVSVWTDCGTIDALLEANRYLLGRDKQHVTKTIGSVIIPPVFIEDGAEVTHSMIGPFVSIAAGAVIKDSIIKNSIINNNAIIQNAVLSASLIGSEAVVRESARRLNVGDASEIILHQDDAG
jgi:glucose-1-phosphate thymidylyltransferase